MTPTKEIELLTNQLAQLGCNQVQATLIRMSAMRGEVPAWLTGHSGKDAIALRICTRIHQLRNLVLSQAQRF